MRASWRVLSISGLLLLLFLGLGCAEEEPRMALESLEEAPGGRFAALAAIEEGGETILAAPAGDRLYVRSVEASSWESRPARWPARVEERGLDFFHLVHQAGEGGDFSPGSYFTYFDEKLWVLALPMGGATPLLLWSEDLGRSWVEAPPPAEAVERRSVHVGSALASTLRFQVAGEELFLLDGINIWRWDLEEGGVVESEMWTPLNTTGVFPEEEGEPQSGGEGGRSGRPGRLLPQRIRHYLPATAASPYEVLTVYGAGLTVFRREEGEELFQEAAVLGGGVDRALQRAPGSEELFLLEHTRLLRSEDGGLEWEDLELSLEGSFSLEGERFGNLLIREREESEAGYRIWLAGTSGSLWRSDDGGESWTAALEEDLDGRAVTAVSAEAGRGRYWVSTAGRGIWRSGDDGESWEEWNHALSASPIFDALLLSEGGVLAGSDGGLFERSDEDGAVRWRKIHDRSTTAIYIQDDRERIISGTMGGSVVIHARSGEGQTQSAAPLGRGEQVHFANPELDFRKIDPAAVVSLARRPGTQNFFAWSSRQGALFSNDGGESWRRMRMGAAFRNALAGAVVTQFLATEEGSFFAVTRSSAPNQPAQIWRSTDGGEGWQAVYSQMENEEERALRLVKLPGEGPLVMSHGSRLAISEDDGESWSGLNGPWAEGRITGLSVDGDQAVLVMQLPYASEILWLRDLESGGEIRARYRLDWPTNWRLKGERIWGVEIAGPEVLLKSSEGVYLGRIPRRQTRLPWSFGLLATLGAILLLSGIGFAYLRRHS